MIPDKIYIPKEEVESRKPWIEQPYEDDPNWDVCYIRKDALLEWAKEKQYESLTIVADNFWQEVIEKINEL